MAERHLLGTIDGLSASLDLRVLDEYFEQVASTRNIRDLSAVVLRFVQSMGFERYDVFVSDKALPGLDGYGLLTGFGNAPAEFQVVHEEPGEAKSDPFMERCRASFRPVFYDQSTYTDVGLGARWEEQASFGYGEGVGYAFRLSPLRRFMFGVDRRDRLSTDPTELTAIVARIQLFATCTQEAAFAIWGETVESPARSLVRLSRRENECLQWAAAGKTAWETGAILSIAEGSVAKLLASAIRKLDCANRSQAVVRALRLGLIH